MKANPIWGYQEDYLQAQEHLQASVCHIFCLREQKLSVGAEVMLFRPGRPASAPGASRYPGAPGPASCSLIRPTEDRSPLLLFTLTGTNTGSTPACCELALMTTRRRRTWWRPPWCSSRERRSSGPTNTRSPTSSPTPRAGRPTRDTSATRWARYYYPPDTNYFLFIYLLYFRAMLVMLTVCEWKTLIWTWQFSCNKVECRFVRLLYVCKFVSYFFYNIKRRETFDEPSDESEIWLILTHSAVCRVVTALRWRCEGGATRRLRQTNLHHIPLGGV